MLDSLPEEGGMFSENLDNCIGESGNKASHGCRDQSCVRARALSDQGRSDQAVREREFYEDKSSACKAGEIRSAGDGQATKGSRWIPWHTEAMKDVVTCDKSRGAGNTH